MCVPKRILITIVKHLIDKNYILQSQIKFGTRYSKQIIKKQLQKYYRFREQETLVTLFPLNRHYFPRIVYQVECDSLSYHSPQNTSPHRSPNHLVF